MIEALRNDDPSIHYYFDVLPIHFPPEHLESFTSYLTRLGEANGIPSVDGLSALCFPDQDRRITRDIADYPLISFSMLPTIGVCTKEKLLATTFFHLAAKFGRSTLPQPLSRFLSGCTSHYLRYCPICLTEQGSAYYQLPWRFLLLTCCAKHQCQLLEKCGQCEKSIPLFLSPFKIGRCPFCKWSLKNGNVVHTTKELQNRAHARAGDIEFLLIPHQWEANSENIIKVVGRGLAHERRRRRITVAEVARITGSPLTGIEGIEGGSFMRKGATFQTYLKYIDFLHLSLKDVFHHALREQEEKAVVPILRPSCPICQLNRSVIRDGYNRRGLQRYECQSCFRSFTISS